MRRLYLSVIEWACVRTVILPKSGKELRLDVSAEGERVVGVIIEFDESIPSTVTIDFAEELNRVLRPQSYARASHRVEFGLSLTGDEFRSVLTAWTEKLDGKLASDRRALEKIISDVESAERLIPEEKVAEASPTSGETPEAS